MTKCQSHVRVGVGVLVRDPLNLNKVFAGLRKNSHGDGTLALPGGHLEMYESWEECAAREVEEETGLKIHNLSVGHVTNDIMEAESKHYVTIFMMGDCILPQGVDEPLPQPQNLEPHKCSGWNSYGWDALRGMLSNNVAREEVNHAAPVLFGPLRRLVEDSPDKVLEFITSSPT